MNFLSQRDDSMIERYSISHRNKDILYEVKNETNLNFEISSDCEIFLNGGRLQALERRDNCSISIHHLDVPNLLYSVKCEWPFAADPSYFKLVWRRFRKNRSLQTLIIPVEVGGFRSPPASYQRIKTRFEEILLDTPENKYYINILSKRISSYADLCSFFTLVKVEQRGVVHKILNFTSEILGWDQENLLIGEHQKKNVIACHYLKKNAYITCYHVDKCPDIICIDIGYMDRTSEKRLFVQVHPFKKPKTYHPITSPTLRCENYFTYQVVDLGRKFIFQDAYEPFYAITPSTTSLSKIKYEAGTAYLVASLQKLNISFNSVDSYQTASGLKNQLYDVKLINATHCRITADIEGMIRVNGIPTITLKSSCILAAYHLSENPNLIKFKKYRLGTITNFKYMLGFEKIDAFECRTIYENFKKTKAMHIICGACFDLDSTLNRHTFPFDVFKLILSKYFQLGI